MVAASCRATGEDAPYYYYGHPLEIVNTLMEKDASDIWKLKKYPAIFLFHDFEETRDKYKSETELRIIIVTDTRPEWKAADRYSNVFEPILLPIYERFIHELSKASGVRFQGEHKIKLFPFWGSEATGANVANDYADAIEIKAAKVMTFPTCTATVYPSNQFDYTLNFSIQ